jgi:hypothetical protein
VEEAVAEPLRPPTLRFADQAEALEEDDQVLGGEHQLQPDLIGSELVEGEPSQAGVLGAANPVLDPGMTSVAHFEDDDVGVLLVSDEGLKAEALEVSESELGARVGSLATADGTCPRGPGCQIEVAQLADGRALAALAGLADRRQPGILGHGQDRLPHGLGEIEADRAALRSIRLMMS